MAYLPLPKAITEKLAQNAERYAQASLKQREWKSSGAIFGFGEEGGVGLRTSVRHLVYQNSGTRPYLMKSLEGRVINIDGHFVTVRNVGKPGFVHLPGGVRKWREQRWRHPGLKPQRFFEQALTQAIREAAPAIRGEILGSLGRYLR